MLNRCRADRRGGRAPGDPRCELLEPRLVLSSAVTTAVRSLTGNIELYPMMVAAHPSQGATPYSSATIPSGSTTPSMMRTYYGVNAINFAGIVGDGRGQTIALVDAYDDPDAQSDLSNFDAAFGLSNPTFEKFNQQGLANESLPSPAATGGSSWSVEESLDIEWAHVIAPAASIDLVEANSSNLTDLFQAASSAADLPGVVAVSMSFGGSEFNGETSYDSTFLTPSGHTNVTFLAATGDTGSPSTYPAYSPNVVAVGGTTMEFASGTTNGTWGGETAWSGSGGGLSGYETRPSYQSSVLSLNKRGNPDVSMEANPATGVPIYDSYDFGTSDPWAQYGGTSLATPMWAGLIAIADQGRVQAGMGTLNSRSQTLPDLYALSSSNFHDITSGSNGGYSAGPGYDEVTGLGSPIANVLVNNLAGVAAAPASSVVGRYIFYNDSLYDGNDPTANANDDNAIDTTKQALLPGAGPATFANYTNYSYGINGVMVDISGLVGTPTLSDFTFLAGDTSTISQWSAAPAPTMLIRPGAGVDGSTRIEFVWANGSIDNKWLQVTVAADADTNLSSPDVFYFGNLIGESDKGAVSTQNGSEFVVTAADVTAAYNDLHSFLDPTTMSDPCDYNRDGKVDATDQMIAGFNIGSDLPVIDPLAPGGSASSSTTDSSSTSTGSSSTTAGSSSTTTNSSSTTPTAGAPPKINGSSSGGSGSCSTGSGSSSIGTGPSAIGPKVIDSPTGSNDPAPHHAPPVISVRDVRILESDWRIAAIAAQANITSSRPDIQPFNVHTRVQSPRRPL